MAINESAIRVGSEVVRYGAKHVCVLVPTKDRPEYVHRLLDSLVKQSEQVSRIIIVASGADIQSIIDEFRNSLPIDYFHTQLTGQIRQRNIGICKLDNRTPLVACIDDDIVLSPTAIAHIVSFWNDAPVDTAGVGFTISNGPAPNVSYLREFLGIDHRQPGRVLQTGMSSSITHLLHDIRSQWLNGGTTVWKRDILVTYPHPEIDCRWAIAEDLIFSYPIGKNFPLYVCARATVEHLELKLHKKPNHWHFCHGQTQTIWLYYFVTSNSDLSPALFLLTLATRGVPKFLLGICTMNSAQFWNALGMARAFVSILWRILGLSAQDDIRLLTKQ